MKRLSVPSQTTQFWFWFILFCCLIGSIFPDYITKLKNSDINDNTSSQRGIVSIITPLSRNKTTKHERDTTYFSELEDYIDKKFLVPKFSISKTSPTAKDKTVKLNLLELEYIDFNAPESILQFDLSQIPKSDELIDIFKAEFERTEDQLKDAYYRSITIIEDKFPNLSIKEGEQQLRSFISNYLGDSEYLTELSSDIKNLSSDQSILELRKKVPSTQEIGEWIEPYADSENIVAEFDNAIRSLKEER
jgi:hypothetical protein